MLAIWAARIGKGSKPEAMQEPNLMPFFVSFAKAGDASWLADDVVTLDDESFGVCWLDDDFA